MPHDIIDNGAEKLIEHVNLILDETERARFAVGYFFVSGFEAIAESLQNIRELRLLIGNTSTRDTVEQLAEGYRQLESVEACIQSSRYFGRLGHKARAKGTAETLRECIGEMPQRDTSAQLIKTLVEMIISGRLKVKVYTKGRLHAKAYIFDYEEGRYESGVSIVGSSNLTLAGLTSNTELNVVVHGDANQQQLRNWFDTLWGESEDFSAALMEELKQSWALAAVRPYDIYMKTVYELVKERIASDDSVRVAASGELQKDLADFQDVAVSQAIKFINEHGGVFISDVVGLGKSYIGAAIIKHFEASESSRPLILCPPGLIPMWKDYNTLYRLNAEILSTGLLSSGEARARQRLFEEIQYSLCDFILIDESHHFRTPGTQRYRILQDFLRVAGKKCCFLTATPRNKSAWDVYHQLKLFHHDDVTRLPLDTPYLHAYFREVEAGKASLPKLLQHILIRRTRNHILRWYGYDSETDEPVNATQFDDYLSRRRLAYVRIGGKKQFFPKRTLKTIEYSIEDTYRGLYRQIREFLSRTDEALPRPTLTYARYGLGEYVKHEKRDMLPYQGLQRAGRNLRGLMRIFLFKRFESSVHAFKTTISRLHNVHVEFLNSLKEGIVPAGDDARKLLYEASLAGEIDSTGETDSTAAVQEFTAVEQDMNEFFKALRKASEQYDIRDFNVPELQRAIEHDIAILKKIFQMVQSITPAEDAKLQTLKKRLEVPPLKWKKRIIFTEYIDTARYLYDNIGGCDTEVIHSYRKDEKENIIGLFSPKSNRYELKRHETELNTLIATDVLAEGMNLQDCGLLINYDLHWNPVRLIQRFGRIDRIGSEFDEIHGFNFLPELGIERHLGLQETLARRIQEIHDTIGEDGAILDNTETLNEDAMYAIYEQNEEQISRFEEPEDVGFGLSEAEEMLRQLKRKNPDEYQRITELRDGIRAGIPSEIEGTYVFCRAGQHLELVLQDENGTEVTTDISEILQRLDCTPELPGLAVPSTHNPRVIELQERFAGRVKEMKAIFPNQHLTPAQKYILNQLKIISHTRADNETGQLEQAFRASLTETVKREINRIRRQKMTGGTLLTELKALYRRYRLTMSSTGESKSDEPPPAPTRVICSASLIKKG